MKALFQRVRDLFKGTDIKIITPKAIRSFKLGKLNLVLDTDARNNTILILKQFGEKFQCWTMDLSQPLNVYLKFNKTTGGKTAVFAAEFVHFKSPVKTRLQIEFEDTFEEWDAFIDWLRKEIKPGMFESIDPEEREAMHRTLSELDSLDPHRDIHIKELEEHCYFCYYRRGPSVGYLKGAKKC